MLARGFYEVSTTISKYNGLVLVLHAGGTFGPADSNTLREARRQFVGTVGKAVAELGGR